jgi:hypothetical protein
MNAWWRWWWSRHPADGPSMRDLQADADRIYTAVRQGHSLPEPGLSVHRQMLAEMGGTAWWEALQDDFDRAVTW